MSSLREHGIEQALIYPRSGCEIEYLSEEWFCTVGYFIESARALDMHIWLYDDFNWPSGDAGGKVTATAEFRLQAISTVGESAGQISVKSRHNAGLFGEKFFPNLLCERAVDYFIECTHEEYFKRFGADFGTTVKGMFTDEPSIGYCTHDEYIPYYEGIKEDYFELCGRNFDDDMRTQHSMLYLDAMTVVSNRFKHCYLDKISSWCENHGLLMTGHFMCDNNPIGSVKHNGSTLKNLCAFSVPGIDEIYTDFEDVCEMSLFAMAEYASKENGAMAELFALGPCDMSYAKKRAMLYFAACHKIDRYFLAISHFDMRGNALVKDYFNTFSADQPDFEAVSELSKEAQKASLIAKKDFCADVYVRFPFLASAKNITRQIDTIPFLTVINELTKNQIQWKYICDEEVNAPVIELTGDLEITLNGEPFDISKIKVEPLVTDLNGNTPEGIFVRRFDDGSFIALNLFAKGSEYIIDNRTVTLKKHDVYLSGEQKAPKNTKIANPVFKIGYKNANIARTMHLEAGALSEIICECDTMASFAIRNGADAYLNDEKIICQNDANLPNGMKKLYKASKPIHLKKGVNTVSATNDLKYLPSVLVLGDFECEYVGANVCQSTLKPRKESYACGNRIYGYGEVEFSTEIHIPADATEIEICGTDLLTKVYINDTLLGKKAFSPYIFPVEPLTKGTTATLKMVQYSSLAPMFGDVDFWDKNVKSCGWRGTPSTTNKSFGFSCILFKN